MEVVHQKNTDFYGPSYKSKLLTVSHSSKLFVITHYLLVMTKIAVENHQS